MELGASINDLVENEILQLVSTDPLIFISILAPFLLKVHYNIRRYLEFMRIINRPVYKIYTVLFLTTSKYFNFFLKRPIF